MTTQDLALEPVPGEERQGQADAGLDDDPSGPLGKLFESSPARSVQTSAAAATAFVLGLLAVLAVPFALMTALSAAMAAVALVAAVIGMARASRPRVAGGLQAALGLVLALTTLAVVGLRYVGIDTAFGDGLAPTLAGWLAALNTSLPMP